MVQDDARWCKIVQDSAEQFTADGATTAQWAVYGYFYNMLIACGMMPVDILAESELFYLGTSPPFNMYGLCSGDDFKEGIYVSGW